MFEKGYYVVNVVVSEHHFLVVAFYLMRVSGLYQLGEVLKYFNSFPLELGVEDVPKVHEVRDVDVVLHHIPSVELIGALLLPKALE